ncbi:MAG: NUDIX domain-containing protein [Euryarchaeota archaeon]|nr:NUDIX domain-containing protein [Euryarchaeota archaeon]
MEHPDAVMYLEHDGKVMLVDSEGDGPQVPVMNSTGETKYRFPTSTEVRAMGIEWDEKNIFDILGIRVTKAHPLVEWPEHWAWKDDCISDDAVHPIARESIYRSIHRLVSKVMILNSEGKVLMGKIERGHFVGHWTLPGGYMDHDEHPAIGCVRETVEEMGIDIELSDDEPIVTQRIFTDEGISFVSFTYKAEWLGDNSQIKLKENEISDYAWLTPKDAISTAVSGFDAAALRHL